MNRNSADSGIPLRVRLIGTWYYATIKGFEVMRALRKGQPSSFNTTRDICGKARLVERAFRLGASALCEAVQFVTQRLHHQAA